MLPILTQSLKDAPITLRGDYYYFIHPITDGVPELTPALLSEVADRIIELVDNGSPRAIHRQHRPQGRGVTGVDKIVTIEAMGIPVGTVLSMKTGIPLVIIRKRKYNLPNEIAVHQCTGYSKGELYLNGIAKGDRVLVVDDVISTGGTMKAVIQALEIAGAEVSDIVVVIERGEGRAALHAAGHDVKTLVSVDASAEGVTINQSGSAMNE